MNFYQHHLGDWAAATAHLTLVEDAVYSRMIRRYYVNELPLPMDHAEVCRLVGARSKAERSAVDSVLAEFFSLEDDGYHQSRCDAEIADYRKRQGDVDAARQAEQERMRRHRQERSDLFAGLRAHGVNIPWNAPIQRVRELAVQYGIKSTCNGPATDLQRGCNGPATANPIANNQPPITKNTHSNGLATEQQSCASFVERDDQDVLTVRALPPATAVQPLQVALQEPLRDQLQADGFKPSNAGRVCKLMRSAGIADVNPGHPRLLALIDAGISDEQFRWAAAQAVERRKGFAYALGALGGAIADASKQIPAGGVVQAMAERPPTKNEIEMFQAAPTLFKGADRERMERFMKGLSHDNAAALAA